jgi:hypothetical protein
MGFLDRHAGKVIGAGATRPSEEEELRRALELARKRQAEGNGEDNPQADAQQELDAALVSKPQKCFLRMARPTGREEDPSFPGSEDATGH